jgi:hypothetical protein
MKIRDLVSGGQIRSRAIVRQQKTSRPVKFELLPDARTSLLAWLERRGRAVDDYVFRSRIDHHGHLSTRHYARLVDECVTGVGLMRSEYGTHSLRRTKASIIYKATGNLEWARCGFERANLNSRKHRGPQLLRCSWSTDSRSTFGGPRWNKVRDRGTRRSQHTADFCDFQQCSQYVLVRLQDSHPHAIIMTYRHNRDVILQGAPAKAPKDFCSDTDSNPVPTFT